MIQCFQSTEPYLTLPSTPKGKFYTCSKPNTNPNLLSYLFPPLFRYPIRYCMFLDILILFIGSTAGRHVDSLNGWVFRERISFQHVERSQSRSSEVGSDGSIHGFPEADQVLARMLSSFIKWASGTDPVKQT